MSGWWLCGFIVVTLNLMVVTSKVDLNSQIRVAQCRATCLYKVTIQPSLLMLAFSREKCLRDIFDALIILGALALGLFRTLNNYILY